MVSSMKSRSTTSFVVLTKKVRAWCRLCRFERLCGTTGVEETLKMGDADSNSIGDELKQIGYACSEPVSSFDVVISRSSYRARTNSLERRYPGWRSRRCASVHRLHGNGNRLGGHAGTLPMVLRKDAMHGAARIIYAVDNVHSVSIHIRSLPVAICRSSRISAIPFRGK